MRSLWRILAVQWLGGDGSEALTGDSTILEGLPYGGNRVYPELSGDSTSPWRVMSLRQSGIPAQQRRGDRAGAEQSEALSRGASHD
jgi:hypothetical protein